jgi:hypothetical protein
MRPTPPTWGALVPLINRQFAPFSGTRVGARFWRQKRSEAKFSFGQGQYGELVTELEGQKWQQA